MQALEAYQHYFKGRIAMGVEVPPEAWGGHVYTIPEVNALADAVNARGAAGMMLWSIQKPGTPSAQDMSTAICNKLGLGTCSARFSPDYSPLNFGSRFWKKAVTPSKKSRERSSSICPFTSFSSASSRVPESAP